MPQLKDRREDILLFANFFLDQANREMDKQLTGFDDKASRALLEYPWPGNLRQMKNMVRRATLLAQGKFITINELNELKEPAPAIIGIPLRNEEAEKHQIIEPCGRRETTRAALHNCWALTAKRCTTS